jgi:hypothetical protein
LLQSHREKIKALIKKENARELQDDTELAPVGYKIIR